MTAPASIRALDPTLDSPIIEAWIRQLLDPATARILAATDGQVEIRLYANGVKVRKRPTIVLNGGPQEMV